MTTIDNKIMNGDETRNHLSESQKLTESSDKIGKNKSNGDQQSACYW